VLLEGGRAVGVEYLRRGRIEVAYAGCEVVLCAGAINSPQLLQLWGIGPGSVLRSHGIKVVRDAPAVGRNLQDHLGIDYLHRSRLPTLNDELYPWHGKLRAGLRYLLLRRGPLSLSVNQAGGFVRSRADLGRPNLQLYFSPVSYVRAPPGQRPLMSPDPYPGFLLGHSVCRPTSRGHLRLRSADPLAAPEIHPNYLSTAHDMAEMLDGVRFLRRLAATPALAALIESELKPGADVRSEEALFEDIRQRSGTVFHPVGTCAMGPDPDRAVVDHRLRVHGLAQLRVIDASVFPCVTSGNTNAPTIMVGEKGAAMILADRP
jgi:choline dehydrogenase